MKHRHERTSWLIMGGHIEWCYVCGAYRQMEVSKTTNAVWPMIKNGWHKPSGNPDVNPWKSTLWTKKSSNISRTTTKITNPLALTNMEEQDWLFEIGERALDGMNENVTIIARALRPEYFENRKQYLTIRESKTFFGKKNIEKWELEVCLTKIIVWTNSS